MTNTYLAADFGGGSGRIYSGKIIDCASGKRLIIREVHRFRNRIVKIGSYLYWDFPALFDEMKIGLAKSANQETNIVSIGIDSWGVDFGLIDTHGNLISNPICYRDSHTSGMPDKYITDTEAEVLYSVTGIQMLPINTLFRLMSMYKSDDPRLQISDKLLFIPDLFSYYLTGNTDNEYTIASTSELLNACEKNWDSNLISHFGFKNTLFGKIIMPGQSRGSILPEISEETGLNSDVKVIAVPSHDTSSAIYAAEADYETDGTGFISSGTWSLLGVTLTQPILTDEARRAGFTNEGGTDGKINFLTNITGLWILQCLTSEWEKTGMAIDWNLLISDARNSKSTGIIDVDNAMFSNPEKMSTAILKYCNLHNITAPSTKGEFVRCICESLAHRYANAVMELNKLLPNPITQLKIFGGGAKNSLLNELTAEYTNLPVVAWPQEATVIGNIISQALADKAITERAEIKEITVS